MLSTFTSSGVLQRVAAFCNVLQCAGGSVRGEKEKIVCCSVLQSFPVSFNLLQCRAVCCSVLQSVCGERTREDSVLQSVAVCCSLLQCRVVCRSLLQRVALYVWRENLGG